MSSSVFHLCLPRLLSFIDELKARQPQTTAANLLALKLATCLKEDLQKSPDKDHPSICMFYMQTFVFDDLKCRKLQNKDIVRKQALAAHVPVSSEWMHVFTDYVQNQAMLNHEDWARATGVVLDYQYVSVTLNGYRVFHPVVSDLCKIVRESVVKSRSPCAMALVVLCDRNNLVRLGNGEDIGLPMPEDVDMRVSRMQVESMAKAFVDYERSKLPMKK